MALRGLEKKKLGRRSTHAAGMEEHTKREDHTGREEHTGQMHRHGERGPTLGVARAREGNKTGREEHTCCKEGGTHREELLWQQCTIDKDIVFDLP